MNKSTYEPVRDLDAPEIMSTEEVMVYLGKSRQTLLNWRRMDKGPIWRKNDMGWVCYLKASVVAWKDSPAADPRFHYNPFAVEKMEEAKRQQQQAWDGKVVNPPGYPKGIPTFKDTFEHNFNADGSVKPGRRIMEGTGYNTKYGAAWELFDPITLRRLNSLDELKAVLDGEPFSAVEARRISNQRLTH